MGVVRLEGGQVGTESDGRRFHLIGMGGKGAGFFISLASGLAGPSPPESLSSHFPPCPPTTLVSTVSRAIGWRLFNTANGRESGGSGHYREREAAGDHVTIGRQHLPLHVVLPGGDRRRGRGQPVGITAGVDRERDGASLGSDEAQAR